MTGEKLSSVGHMSSQRGGLWAWRPGWRRGRERLSSAFLRPEAGAAFGIARMRMRLAEESGAGCWNLPWERREPLGGESGIA